MHVSQTRSGRRSISVDNLLRKDKEGKLFRDAPKPDAETKVAGSGVGNAGSSINFNSPAVSYSPEYTAGPITGAEARPKRKKGEPPSREDVETRSTQDGRGNMQTIPGTGTQWTDVGAANQSL